MANSEQELKNTISSRKSALRFQEQALLTLLAPELSKFNYNVYDKDGKPMPRHKYYNFSRIDPESTSAQQLMSGVMKNKDIFFMEKIPPPILSLLVPSISLYKTFFEQDGALGFDWKIPFDDYLGASEISRNSIQELLTSGEGRLNGVGVKSFSYSYKAVNYAEVNSNIDATLKLKAATIEDLIKIVKIPTNHKNYAVDANEKPQVEQKFCYTDLFYSQQRENLRNINGGRWNINYFKLKVICGYSSLDAGNLARKIKDIGYQYYDQAGKPLLNTDADIQTFVEAIRQAKVVLSLTPVSHDLGFNEDGSVDVSINFKAYMDSFLSDPDTSDIFRLSDEYIDFLRAKVEYEKKTKELSTELAKVDEQFCKDKNAEQFKNSKKALRADVEQSKEILESLKGRIHSGLLVKLLKKHGLYEIAIPAKYIDKIGENQYINEEEATKRRLQHASEISTEFYPTKLSPEQALSVIEQSRQASIPTNPDEKNSANEKDAYGKLANYTLKEDYATFYYFYLGDIIDVVFDVFNQFGDKASYASHLDDVILDKLTELPKEQKPKVVLGSILMHLPVSPSISGATPEDEFFQERTINISDIPISLNYFNQFFITNVVRRAVDSYPLRHFLYDIFKDNGLVSSAMSSRAFGIQFAGVREKLSIINLCTSNSIGRRDRILGSSVYGLQTDQQSTFGTYNINSKLFLNNTFYDVEEALKFKESNYIFIEVITQFPKKLFNNIKNEAERININKNNGVFTFRVGSDLGLQKKINFNKIDQPYLAEARSLSAGEVVNGKLRQKFNVTIDMFGNNIFRPGEIIFVDPSFFITKNINNYQTDLKAEERYPEAVRKIIANSKKLQDTLGLSGYYSIDTVDTDIELGKFETKIKCTFVAYGNGQMATNGKVNPPELCELPKEEDDQKQDAGFNERVEKILEEGNFEVKLPSHIGGDFI